MKWIDVKKETPKTENLVSNNVLFCCDNGQVDAGHYHTNGCFYGIDISAKTCHATHARLPKITALFWCEFPKAPKKR